MQRGLVATYAVSVAIVLASWILLSREISSPISAVVHMVAAVVLMGMLVNLGVFPFNTVPKLLKRLHRRSPKQEGVQGSFQWKDQPPRP